MTDSALHVRARLERRARLREALCPGHAHHEPPQGTHPGVGAKLAHALRQIHHLDVRSMLEDLLLMATVAALFLGVLGAAIGLLLGVFWAPSMLIGAAIGGVLGATIGGLGMPVLVLHEFWRERRALEAYAAIDPRLLLTEAARAGLALLEARGPEPWPLDDVPQALVVCWKPVATGLRPVLVSLPRGDRLYMYDTPAEPSSAHALYRQQRPPRAQQPYGGRTSYQGNLPPAMPPAPHPPHNGATADGEGPGTPPDLAWAEVLPDDHHRAARVRALAARPHNLHRPYAVFGPVPLTSAHQRLQFVIALRAWAQGASGPATAPSTLPESTGPSL